MKKLLVGAVLVMTAVLSTGGAAGAVSGEQRVYRAIECVLDIKEVLDYEHASLEVLAAEKIDTMSKKCLKVGARAEEWLGQVLDMGYTYEEAVLDIDPRIQVAVAERYKVNVSALGLGYIEPESEFVP